MARCRVSRSARASSNSMISMSFFGSTGSSRTTWAFSKHRTTWRIASVSRMLARNLFPRPSPFEAPAIRPAMSTTFTTAGMTFSVSMCAVRRARLSSGTSATAWLGSMVQKGKFPISAPAAVRALKRVLFPTLGRPTMPQERDMALARDDGPSRLGARATARDGRGVYRDGEARESTIAGPGSGSVVATIGIDPGACVPKSRGRARAQASAEQQGSVGSQSSAGASAGHARSRSAHTSGAKQSGPAGQVSASSPQRVLSRQSAPEQAGTAAGSVAGWTAPTRRPTPRDRWSPRRRLRRWHSS